MTPAKFPESNTVFRPPPDLTEEQCRSIPAFNGRVQGGSLDGAPFIVVAWQPSADEVELLKQGKPLFLSFIGGLPPHFPSMTFVEATHPS